MCDWRQRHVACIDWSILLHHFCSVFTGAARSVAEARKLLQASTICCLISDMSLQEVHRSVADGKPGELTTLTPESETGTIPRSVADGLDAVVTLGGDGTVLWTCSILGNGSVPPLVPFAMGSLGFMTPFAMEKMTKTLDQVQPSLLLCQHVHVMCIYIYEAPVCEIYTQ